MDIIADIKKITLEWIGHITKNGPFESKPEGRRRMERPRLRWLEDDEKMGDECEKMTAESNK